MHKIADEKNFTNSEDTEMENDDVEAITPCTPHKVQKVIHSGSFSIPMTVLDSDTEGKGKNTS